MKFKERPTERVREKGSKQGRYERGRTFEDDGREELKIPRPKKSPTLGKMCVYCGRVYPWAEGDDELICPTCASPSADPSPAA